MHEASPYLKPMQLLVTLADGGPQVRRGPSDPRGQHIPRGPFVHAGNRGPQDLPASLGLGMDPQPARLHLGLPGLDPLWGWGVCLCAQKIWAGGRKKGLSATTSSKLGMQEQCEASVLVLGGFDM